MVMYPTGDNDWMNKVDGRSILNGVIHEDGKIVQDRVIIKAIKNELQLLEAFNLSISDITKMASYSTILCSSFTRSISYI